MGKNYRFLLSIFWIVLGIVLCACHFCGLIEEYWSSMGFALVVVGILQVIRHIRYRTNRAYQEKMDIEVQDERNKFIANKAWAWAGYIFILAMAAAVIVLKIIGQDMLSTAAAFTVCFMLVLYWGAYMVLKRKY